MIALNRTHTQWVMRMGNHAVKHEYDKLIDDNLSFLATKAGKRDWLKFGHKFNDWVRCFANGERWSAFSVVVEGNNKLAADPVQLEKWGIDEADTFYQFNAMPFVTCPGMGPCAVWCYSRKAFRYPAAVYRMLQNTILVTRGRDVIRNNVHMIPTGSTLRLYVDGDFDSVETFAFWMNLIGETDLQVYGYSKSWAEILTYVDMGGAVPDNYLLNLSSGGKRIDLRERMAELPFTRGEFIGVNVKTKRVDDWTQFLEEAQDAARAQGLKKFFVCPGKCGSCTPRGHACGLQSFKGIPIVEGIRP